MSQACRMKQTPEDPPIPWGRRVRCQCCTVCRIEGCETPKERQSLTFITATWPVESGVVKAGLSPSVLIVSIGPERAPSRPIVKVCRPPLGFSFTALHGLDSIPESKCMQINGTHYRILLFVG